jgi:hypothetical protein
MPRINLTLRQGALPKPVQHAQTDPRVAALVYVAAFRARLHDQSPSSLRSVEAHRRRLIPGTTPLRRIRLFDESNERSEVARMRGTRMRGTV